MSFEKMRLRAFLWFELKLNKNTAEAYRSLSKVFGMIFYWKASVDAGLSVFEMAMRAGKTRSTSTMKSRAAIESDPCKTTQSLAEQFTCTHGTIENHLNAIGKSNRCGKFGPHDLSAANKVSSITLCGILIRRSKSSDFLFAENNDVHTKPPNSTNVKSNMYNER
uniref:Mos1 transposase HTH domain-containing protein n=2 Tax=Caenorhabditis japonica TaxID=281687 RepID=A0A8R1E723_CAEJA